MRKLFYVGVTVLFLIGCNQEVQEESAAQDHEEQNEEQDELSEEMNQGNQQEEESSEADNSENDAPAEQEAPGDLVIGDISGEQVVESIIVYDRDTLLEDGFESVVTITDRADIEAIVSIRNSFEVVAAERYDGEDFENIFGMSESILDGAYELTFIKEGGPIYSVLLITHDGKLLFEPAIDEFPIDFENLDLDRLTTYYHKEANSSYFEALVPYLP
ncbi:hypothetical protein [Evansella cellulosilytica]|uniref:Uncharacterized protein n=1 Tax=Evansella cellulosilytica (strain ATCC 21833 / DSM 2522 / FERM P-1141 / JCM 9156 / N-4) TaxID=649639 RepID=E6TTW3_EVAC2|nr:hypothetical protein [Evansella cellulosilytica]ADU31994.1 hypothetical protein Bcell_3754 [Evansella cellulosilytica DSM 2522]